mgnify:CR=1 FL=1
MIDVLAMAVGGGLFAGGFLTGLATRALPARRTGPNPPALACSCTHPHSVHDHPGATCGGQTRREHYWPAGSRNGWEWVPCPCTGYDGPEPMSVLAPRGLVLPGPDR